MLFGVRLKGLMSKLLQYVEINDFLTPNYSKSKDMQPCINGKNRCVDVFKPQIPPQETIIGYTLNLIGNLTLLLPVAMQFLCIAF
jgi:hypothetical protein